jgi:hypothetical protein
MGGKAAWQRPQAIAGLSYTCCRRGGAPSSDVMKQSLRKTPSRLHLAYRYGERSDALIGRHFSLAHDGTVLTLAIDLSANFQTRNKSAAAYLDAVNLVHNHHKLESVQCGDNLVRSRMIKAWERVTQPQLRMCLDLGHRGRYLYSVQPHSLLTGGMQLEVQEVLEEDTRVSRPSPAPQLDNPRNHP